MTRCAYVRTILVTVMLAGAGAAMAQRFPAPPGWKWVTDAPARAVDTLDPAEGSFLFGTMAPGWHITTHSGVVLFEPAQAVRGRFVIDSESFIFPGESQDGFGVFAGGRDLETAAAGYTAFLIRRDGSAAITRRDGGKTTFLREWTRHAAIKAHPGGDANIGNVIRVEAEADVVNFNVNGTKVLDIPRAAAGVDGIVGMRVGAGINVHVTNLDITSKLALPRPVRKPGLH